MKTTFTFTRAAAAVLIAGMTVFGSVSAAVAAEARPTPVLGIVDTDLILQEALASKGVRLERDKYATTYQNQVKDMEGKLRAEDQELSQQRGVLAPDVFQQRAQTFQQKLADFQTRKSALRKELYDAIYREDATWWSMVRTSRFKSLAQKQAPEFAA